MKWPLDILAQLSRMEESRRQTQRQLDQINRQITRRMTALIPLLLPKRTGYRRGKSPDPGAFLERYRTNLAAITAERQSEIDALERKLGRQDRAIATLREHHHLDASRAKPIPGPQRRRSLAGEMTSVRRTGGIRLAVERD